MVPLDRSHVQAVDHLVDALVTAAGVPAAARSSEAHITVVAYAGLPGGPARRAVAPVAAATAPFTTHAHGYGLFTGTDPADLSLHVPVVRSGPLDALHRAACDALVAAGAEIAGWSAPGAWSPHITLVDRNLDPSQLGAAVAWLARRPHPSWCVTVDRVALAGSGQTRGRRHGPVLRLGAPAGPPPIHPEGAST
ncbi:MAG TPA: 2'-5' RNA ligase family protein [Acidimicrobiales bacterium]|nr:2'-5' RNA ligase family protein [Acidimicrobiales bacterium]